MPLDRTLLDLDRVPTLDELKAFFRKHDWSAAQLSDPSSWSPDKAEAVEYIKRILNAEFEKVAREKGLGAASIYFENVIRTVGTYGSVSQHQGNPLLELRDNTENLISDAVYELGANSEDVLDEILGQFDFTDPDFEKKADAFLHNAVSTMLDVMEYDKLAELIGEMSAFEDFNPKKKSNFRAEDHDRRWYHTDTKHPTFPDPDAEELAKEQHPRTEEAAISNIMVEEYWKSLDEKDRRILRMTMDGYTQDEIARTVGFANNSAVSKRIAKLRNDFVRKTGVKIE